jgi:hypothetical protein
MKAYILFWSANLGFSMTVAVVELVHHNPTAALGWASAAMGWACALMAAT